MNFSNKLEHATTDSRNHILGAPVVEAIREGRFDLESYTWFLEQAYHHVRHTVPLMMACGARLDADHEWVREALVHYIEDEYGHQEWILDDLAACGADPERVRNGRPGHDIELMVAWLYDSIHRGNPLAFFGMVHVLEGTSIRLATSLGEQIQRHLSLPKEAFSYLYSHGALDQEHYRFFEGLMNRITDPADQEAVIHASRTVGRLYGNMLHNIPLPEHKRIQDEVA